MILVVSYYKIKTISAIMKVFQIEINIKQKVTAKNGLNRNPGL